MSQLSSVPVAPGDSANSPSALLERIALTGSLIAWAGNSRERLADADDAIDRILGDLGELLTTESEANGRACAQMDALRSQLEGERTAKSRQLLLKTLEKLTARSLRSSTKKRGLAALGRLSNVVQAGLIVTFLCLVVFWSIVYFRYPNFNVRTVDLQTIAAALENYRADRGEYPLSGTENNRPKFLGIGWSGDDKNWLPGLVPQYLEHLPIDPRNSNIPEAQYIYASDGRAYKLVAMQPEDCRAVVLLRPWLRDPVRSSLGGTCNGYGIYTSGAENF
jgi:hypothetical protein